MNTVTFFPKVIVYEYLHRFDYSNDELKNSFYSKRELKIIKKENNKDIIWIIGGKQQQGKREVFCSLGLENKTPINLRRQKKHRGDSIAAVLHEQQNQGNQKDQELIATVYSVYSKIYNKERQK